MKILQNQSIALFVGAGVVKNSWKPILRVLQPEYLNREISSEVANSSLARLIYLLRWAYSFGETKNVYGFEEYMQILHLTRKRISQEIAISLAKKEITVQDEFSSIATQIVLANCKQLMIVSTNWDTVFEDALNSFPIFKRIFAQKIHVAHLHGIYTDPSTLYLPTEATDEPYRTKDEENILGGMHMFVMEHVEEADVIIIYGLSLSSLDAELAQIIGVAIDHPNLKSVIIIDPAHRIIADKICMLLAYPSNVSVFGYHPADLNTEFDYSLY